MEVSVLHDVCGEVAALDHPGLVCTDQLVAMRALLHALRLLALLKVYCRAKGMRVRARVWWGGGWWRECKGASVAMWSGGGVNERCHLREMPWSGQMRGKQRGREGRSLTIMLVTFPTFQLARF